jgi:single-stranded DNA-specific DHH superfamily exonuclease
MNVDKAVDFLENVKGNVGVFFHDDADGACSGALINSVLKDLEITTTLACGPIDKSSFDAFKFIKTDYVIILDLAVDQYPDWLAPFDKKTTMIIDHHPLHNDLNKLGFLHINSRFEDSKKYVSASEICMEICKKIGLKNKDWIGRLGAVGDKSIEGEPDEQEAAEMIDANKSVRGPESIIKIAKFLTTANKLDDFLYTTEFRKPLETIKGEIERQVKKFEMTDMADVNFFEFKGNYSMLSMLSNALFERYPKKTIIVYRRSEGFMKVSGRSHKFDLGKIFSDATKGIGEGGGHPQASGAKMKEKDFDIFKKRVLKELEV